MNTDTGRIYRGSEIDEALARGEPVVPVSERVAKLVEAGKQVQKQRRRRANKRARASRKENR